MPVLRLTPRSSLLGAGERSHARGEVVRLRRQQDVRHELLLHEARRLAGRLRLDRRDREAADGRRVVVERDDAVRTTLRRQRVLHDAEQRAVLLLAINHHVAAEEPVARVFTIRLRNVEQLHVRRVALQNVAEQVRVVLQVLLIERQTELRVQLPLTPSPHTHLLQLLLAASQHRVRLDRGRFHSRLEGAQTRQVRLLRHVVVHRVCSLTRPLHLLVNAVFSSFVSGSVLWTR